MENRTIRCVWEHNGDDTLLYAVDYIGAYARGENLEAAKEKMVDEISAYLKWRDEGTSANEFIENTEVETVRAEFAGIEIVQEKSCDLQIKDADSDVIFEEEKQPLSMEEYLQLKELALKSAKDFLKLYEAIPDKNKSALPKRVTFYGEVPRTAQEMYEHTKNVNAYYFAEIDVDADNEGDIYQCRKRGFEKLERKEEFLMNPVIEGSYGEEWSLRKVMRRFVWHDRIHAKAMHRMAEKTFGKDDDVHVNAFKFI